MGVRAVAPIAVALIAGYALFSNPNVVLRSSDGQWADSEIRLKDRTFGDVVWNFEGYKLQCSAPNAVLVRATPELWFDVFAWPSYLSDPKWHVPYSAAHPEIGDYYPPANEQNCYNGGWSPQVMESARANAAAYLARLH